MIRSINGATALAGVVGSPVRHSLSPLIHNAWLAGADVDGVYVAFSVQPDGFAALVRGFRGGVVRGLNVTIPFKEEALALADHASDRARRAGAANLLRFDANGEISADNTDGAGLLIAFAQQAPQFDPTARPAVILGAGGAARGAVGALLDAGVSEIRLINRTRAKAQDLADAFGARVRVFGWAQIGQALVGAGCVINATSLGLGGHDPLEISLDGLAPGSVVMDMVYRPLRTAFLQRAEVAGLVTVDGLAMLVGQAVPSFEAFFGQSPPPQVDVRALALQALEAQP